MFGFCRGAGRPAFIFSFRLSTGEANDAEKFLLDIKQPHPQDFLSFRYFKIFDIHETSQANYFFVHGQKYL